MSYAFGVQCIAHGNTHAHVPAFLTQGYPAFKALTCPVCAAACMVNTLQGGIATAVQHHGKEMSYNNYLDADAAYSCCCDFKVWPHTQVTPARPSTLNNTCLPGPASTLLQPATLGLWQFVQPIISKSFHTRLEYVAHRCPGARLPDSAANFLLCGGCLMA